MLVIPAIDMQGHQAVRLSQGDFKKSTSYSDSIPDQASTWVEQGAKRLHLVDLDGAKSGAPAHSAEIAEILKNHPDVPVQVGGGIRSEETLDHYAGLGVQFFILGTAAIKDPGFAKAMIQKYPGRVILGLDAKGGKLATEGWLDVGRLDAFEFALGFQDEPVAAIVYTDIAKDGMLVGMNIEELKKMASQKIPVIASGGLTSLEDIEELKRIGNICGVIAGKALYESKISPQDIF